MEKRKAEGLEEKGLKFSGTAPKELEGGPLGRVNPERRRQGRHWGFIPFSDHMDRLRATVGPLPVSRPRRHEL